MIKRHDSDRWEKHSHGFREGILNLATTETLDERSSDGVDV